MAQRKKKSHHIQRKLLTAGAVALGTYLLYGAENAKQNRKKAKSWMLKAKKEVVTQAAKLKELDRKDYEQIVNKVEAKYKKLKNIDKSDVASLAKELHGHWKNIEKELKKGVGKPTRKKAAKKTTKKKK